jgi:hypothetical protein
MIALALKSWINNFQFNYVALKVRYKLDYLFFSTYTRPDIVLELRHRTDCQNLRFLYFTHFDTAATIKIVKRILHTIYFILFSLDFSRSKSKLFIPD